MIQVKAQAHALRIAERFPELEGREVRHAKLIRDSPAVLPISLLPVDRVFDFKLRLREVRDRV
jgi:hypothetical protein